MKLADITLDCDEIASRKRSVPEQVAVVTQRDLPGFATELYDLLDAATAGLTDAQVRFIPRDENESGESGWNVAHLVLHVTASAEEGVALGSSLARNVEFTGRSRFEPEWETVTTAAQVQQRLAESRRMTQAFLETWPDAPYLQNTYEHPYFGTMNAMSQAVAGLYHGFHHLPQVKEAARQATAAE